MSAALTGVHRHGQPAAHSARARGGSDDRRRRPIGFLHRLAPMARTRSQQRLEGDRPPQAMGRRPVRRSCGRCRASAPATARSRSRTTASSCKARPAGGSVVYALNRADGKGAVVEGARAGGQQRQGIRAEKHADRRRRPHLRPDGERRSGVPESAGRRGRLAAQHPEGFRRTQHQSGCSANRRSSTATTSS